MSWYLRALLRVLVPLPNGVTASIANFQVAQLACARLLRGAREVAQHKVREDRGELLSVLRRRVCTVAAGAINPILMMVNEYSGLMHFGDERDLKELRFEGSCDCVAAYAWMWTDGEINFFRGYASFIAKLFQLLMDLLQISPLFRPLVILPPYDRTQPIA